MKFLMAEPPAGEFACGSRRAAGWTTLTQVDTHPACQTLTQLAPPPVYTRTDRPRLRAKRVAERPASATPGDPGRSPPAAAPPAVAAAVPAIPAPAAIPAVVVRPVVAAPPAAVVRAEPVVQAQRVPVLGVVGRVEAPGVQPRIEPGAGRDDQPAAGRERVEVELGVRLAREPGRAGDGEGRRDDEAPHGVALKRPAWLRALTRGYASFVPTLTCGGPPPAGLPPDHPVSSRRGRSGSTGWRDACRRAGRAS